MNGINHRRRIKRDDLNKYLGVVLKRDLNQIEEVIQLNRKAEGKPQNKYLVLNLEDEINTWELLNSIEVVAPLTKDKNHGIKVKDIAVALVNAILKAKGG